MARRRGGRPATLRLTRIDPAVETRRYTEEVLATLGGHYAHVNDEAISPKHDDAAGEVWLHGRFTYILYRRPAGT